MCDCRVVIHRQQVAAGAKMQLQDLCLRLMLSQQLVAAVVKMKDKQQRKRARRGREMLRGRL